MVRVIGGRVQALRRGRGLSQAELAARSGLTRSHVWRVENDERPGVQAVVLGRLAAALHTTSDYLLGLTANPAVPPPVDWRADPADLARMHRLIDRLVRLPLDRQERVMDAVLTLIEVSEVVNGEGIEASGLLGVDLAPAAAGR
jgi:transcriptional regulator with XRE-family HTH domain